MSASSAASAAVVAAAPLLSASLNSGRAFVLGIPAASREAPRASRLRNAAFISSALASAHESVKSPGHRVIALPPNYIQRRHPDLNRLRETAPAPPGIS